MQYWKTSVLLVCTLNPKIMKYVSTIPYERNYTKILLNRLKELLTELFLQQTNLPLQFFHFSKVFCVASCRSFAIIHGCICFHEV